MISNKKLDHQLIKLPNDIKFCQEVRNFKSTAYVFSLDKNGVCSACAAH